MGAFLVFSPSVRAQTLTSLTYSGTINVAWTGIVADYDGPLDLSTNLKFTVTLDQPSWDGGLQGTANGTGTLTGTWSVDDPEYPSGCPTQVSISGSYTFQVTADANSTQVTFYADGPNNWNEVDNPQPGSGCWPGVDMGGIPLTYTEYQIMGFFGECFGTGGPCQQYPPSGGTNNVCPQGGFSSTCEGSEEVDLISSTTETTTSTTTTSTTASTNMTTATTTTGPANSTSTTSTSSPSSPTLYLYEGLAPAASTTGDDNVYIGIHWDGQTPVSVDIGAFSANPSITVGFASNPITIYSADTRVLMNIDTLHTADGTYTINVAAQLTDPQSGNTINAGINVLVTVSAGTIFVVQQNQQAEAIWLKGLSSPFMVSGGITASQYSNFAPTVDSSGKLTDLAFTVTGPAGTMGVGTLTIPKALVAPGLDPILSIDGAQVAITVTQDSTNYYITYATAFSTHNVLLSFVQANSTATLSTTPNTATSASTGTGIHAILIIEIIVLPLFVAGVFIMVRVRKKATRQ